jgi:hypothetical protein
MMEEIALPKSRFWQELQGVASQKTAFFIDTEVNTSDITNKTNSVPLSSQANYTVLANATGGER